MFLQRVSWKEVLQLKMFLHNTSPVDCQKNGQILIKGLVHVCYSNLTFKRPREFRMEHVFLEDDVVVLRTVRVCQAVQALETLKKLILEVSGGEKDLPDDVSSLLNLMRDANQFMKNGALALRHPCFMNVDEVERVYSSLWLFQRSSQAAREFVLTNVKLRINDKEVENWVDYAESFLKNVNGEEKITTWFLKVLKQNCSCKERPGLDDEVEDVDYVKPFSCEEFKKPCGIIAYFTNVFCECEGGDYVKVHKLTYLLFPRFLSDFAEVVSQSQIKEFQDCF